jgi:DNA transposition AAA+ family ATPase
MNTTIDEAHDLSSFITTKEYLRFVEFCDACEQHRYIGLCYGVPGVGKTHSALRSTQWSLIQQWAAHTDDKARAELAVATVQQCRAVFYTAPVSNTPGRVWQQILASQHALDTAVRGATQLLGQTSLTGRTQQHTRIIVVDEADRLTTNSLEQLRDIYDQTGIGLVLIGMPGLEKRLARYAQLYSRVGFVHQFRLLSLDEMTRILTQKWGEVSLAFDPANDADATALNTIIRMTGGNFRLIDRLFAQIARVLRINTLQRITKEVVEAARESLVIGTG